MKSNQKCCICGKICEDYNNIFGTKTKRNSYVIVHKQCLVKGKGNKKLKTFKELDKIVDDFMKTLDKTLNN